MGIPENWTNADKRKDAEAASLWVREEAIYHQRRSDACTHLGQYHKMKADRYAAVANLLDAAFVRAS